MTIDREKALLDLLGDCQQAFDVIPNAASSRKMLKKIGIWPRTYEGNGSHILAREMSERIAKFLKAL